jgi:hypothetical protein
MSDDISNWKFKIGINQLVNAAPKLLLQNQKKNKSIPVNKLSIHHETESEMDSTDFQAV